MVSFDGALDPLAMLPMVLVREFRIWYGRAGGRCDCGVGGIVSNVSAGRCVGGSCTEMLL